MITKLSQDKFRRLGRLCFDLVMSTFVIRPNSRKAGQRPLEAKKGTFSAVFSEKGCF